jgi:hypothetical protein
VWVVDVEAGPPVTAAPFLVDRSNQVGVTRCDGLVA